MSFVKCDVYQECQALYDAAAKAADGCCGTVQCPNVVLPHREFHVGHYGAWAPEMEFKFHALCVVVSEQREIIASLMERLDVQAEVIAQLLGPFAAPPTQAGVSLVSLIEETERGAPDMVVVVP